MLKNKILDFYDDAAGMIAKEALEKFASASEIAQQAIPTHNELQNLHNNEFALVYVDANQDVHRKFPVDSAASTALSSEYFAKTASQLPDQAREIAGSCLKIACVAFELPVPSHLEGYKEDGFKNFYKENGLETFAEEQTKVASEQQTYALNGQYPINDEFQIKLAERYFNTYSHELTADDRATFASNLVKKASDLSISVDPEIARHANTSKWGDYVGEQIAKRMQAFDENDEHREFLNKVASVWPETDPALFKDTLAKFDSMTGLDKHYGRNGLKDAHSATYETNPMKKEAEAAVWKSKHSGKSMSKKQIEKCAEEKFDTIKRHLGETYATGLKKQATEIFLSTPIDAQEIIAQIALGELK